MKRRLSVKANKWKEWGTLWDFVSLSEKKNNNNNKKKLLFSPVLAHSISPNYNNDFFFFSFVLLWRSHDSTFSRMIDFLRPFASLRLRTKLMRALRRAGAQGTNFFFAEMRKSKDFDGDEVIQQMVVVVVVCGLIWTGATAADLYRE